MPWYDKGMTPEKDKRMEMTQENFYRVIAMRDEIIFEQKDEISKLKHKANNLVAKVKSLQNKLKEQ